MDMVGVAGFEPTTPCPPDKCANRAALHSDWRRYSEAARRWQRLGRYRLVSLSRRLHSSISASASRRMRVCGAARERGSLWAEGGA